MKKQRLTLRKVIAIAVCLAATTMFFSCEKPSSNKQITAFGFTAPPATGMINEDAKTITVTVPQGTNVTALVPIITVSDKATVTPASGIAQNFTHPVTYTVTAENGSKANYVVTVTISGGGGGGGGGGDEEDCTGERETAPDTEIGAIRMLANGQQTYVFTYDNDGARERWDVYVSGNHVIYLNNHLTGENLFWEKTVGWQLFPYPYQGAYKMNVTEAEYVAVGWKREGCIDIAGKYCHLYSGMTADGYPMKQAIWNGLVMLIEGGAGLYWIGLGVTLNVPEKAFSMATIEVDWI